MKNAYFLPQVCNGNVNCYFSMLKAFGCAVKMDIGSKNPNPCDYSVGNLLWVTQISGRFYNSDDWLLEINLALCPDVLIDGPCALKDKFAIVGCYPEYLRRCELVVSSNRSATFVKSFFCGKKNDSASLLPKRRVMSQIRALEKDLLHNVDLSRLETPRSTRVKTTGLATLIVESFGDFLCSNVVV